METTKRFMRAAFAIFQALEESHRRDGLALERVRQQPRPQAFCLRVDDKDVRVSRVWTRRDVKRQEWLDGKGDYIPIGRLDRRLGRIWPREGEAPVDRLYREAKGELLRLGVYADIAPRLSEFKAAFDCARDEFLAASQFDGADIPAAFARLCEAWSNLKSELPELENAPEPPVQGNGQPMRSGNPPEIHYPPEVIASAEAIKRSRDMLDAQLRQLAHPVSGGTNTTIQGWTVGEIPPKADEKPLPKWDAATEARNKWLYEEWQNGTTAAAIIKKLNKKSKTWGRIETDAGIKKQVKAYADHHGLPQPTQRRKGRRPGQTQ